MADPYETLGVAKNASARTRSRRPTASSRASTTRTRTRATTRPRSASRRSSTAYDVLSDAGEAEAVRPLRLVQRSRQGPGGGFNWTRPRASTSATSAISATSSAGSSAAAAAARSQRGQRGQRRRGARSTSRSRTRSHGVETKIPVELETACRTAAARARSPGRRRALPGVQAAAASSPRARASSRCRSRARAAAATARSIEEPCPTCHGSGRERRTKRYTVKIPAGRQGRLADPPEAARARPATAARPAGDLYVVTRVQPSKTFTRRGDDLVVDVPVALSRGRARRDDKVPTPDGAGHGQGPARHRRTGTSCA